MMMIIMAVVTMVMMVLIIMMVIMIMIMMVIMFISVLTEMQFPHISIIKYKPTISNQLHRLQTMNCSGITDFLYSIPAYRLVHQCSMMAHPSSLHVVGVMDLFVQPEELQVLFLLGGHE
jgi:hypothetical protein